MPICTHSVEFDGFYRAEIYGRPCMFNGKLCQNGKKLHLMNCMWHIPLASATFQKSFWLQKINRKVRKDFFWLLVVSKKGESFKNRKEEETRVFLSFRKKGHVSLKIEIMKTHPGRTFRDVRVTFEQWSHEFSNFDIDILSENCNHFTVMELKISNKKSKRYISADFGSDKLSNCLIISVWLPIFRSLLKKTIQNNCFPANVFCFVFPWETSSHRKLILKVWTPSTYHGTKKTKVKYKTKHTLKFGPISSSFSALLKSWTFDFSRNWYLVSL